MALVPVWGSNVRGGKVSREQADIYSAWLAKRYADKNNVIWLIGGDVRGSDSTATWNLMGDNIRKYAPDHLITFHPFGRTRSSMWFHHASWSDFNMFQSGHRRYDQDDTEFAYGQDNWKYVRDDYRLNPVKPTIDGEPSYEGIPQGLHDPAEPFWKDNDTEAVCLLVGFCRRIWFYLRTQRCDANAQSRRERRGVWCEGGLA